MLYSKFKESLLNGITFDLPNDTLKVALLTSGYIPNDNDEFLDDVSAHEVVGSGYIAGGEALQNKSVTNEDNRVTFDADDVSWNIDGQISALYAVIYKDTGDPATSRLISLKQFLYLRVVINDSITLEWANDGIFRLR